MKRPDADLNRAFPETPDIIHQHVQEGFRMGRLLEARRRRRVGYLTAAAAALLVALVGMLALRPGRGPAPDVLASGTSTVRSGGMPEVVYFSAENEFYHALPNCGSLPGLRPVALETARQAGKTACPVCLPGREAEDAADTGMPTEAPDGGAEISQTAFAPTPEPTPTAAVPTLPPESPMGSGSTSSPAAESAVGLDAPFTEQDLTVYYTPKGQFFHRVFDCSGMENAQESTLAQAFSEYRQPCPVCLRVDLALYADPEANPYYHVDHDCPGLKGLSAGTTDWASALSVGLTACPDCNALLVLMESLDPLYEESYYATESGNYYHSDSNCSGMVGASLQLLSLCESRGQKPCPVCVSGANPDSESVGLITYYATSAGRYCHLDPACSGMKNALPVSFMTAAERGQMPCPVCVRDKGNDSACFCAFARGLFDRLSGLPLAEFLPEETGDQPVSGYTMDQNSPQSVCRCSVSWDDGDNGGVTFSPDVILYNSYSLECSYGADLYPEEMRLEVTFTDDAMAHRFLEGMDGPLTGLSDAVEGAFFPSVSSMFSSLGSEIPEHPLAGLCLTLDGKESITACQLFYLVPHEADGRLQVASFLFTRGSTGALALDSFSWNDSEDLF